MIRWKSKNRSNKTKNKMKIKPYGNMFRKVKNKIKAYSNKLKKVKMKINQKKINESKLFIKTQCASKISFHHKQIKEQII